MTPAKIKVGDTVYFEDFPDKGKVIEIEESKFFPYHLEFDGVLGKFWARRQELTKVSKEVNDGSH